MMSSVISKLRLLFRKRKKEVKVGIHTNRFLNNRYVVNNPQGIVLNIGDFVWVHPTGSSCMREKYMGQITLMYWNLIDNPGYELTMEARNGYPYKALMNLGMMARLEFIKRENDEA